MLPEVEPYQRDGGPVGVLLCHGFTGSPSSMRPWAEHLAAAGMTVSLPRLPGHGTDWRDLARTVWSDWYGEVDAALTRLSGRCESVVVAGLSMGGSLALRLAIHRPDDVAGLILVNPALTAEDRRLSLLPVLKHLVPSVPGIGNDIRKPGVSEHGYDRTPLKPLHSLLGLWSEVRADLARITQPVLLFVSRVDHVVPPSSARVLLAGISSKDVTERVLQDSFHVATLDHDAPTIFAESLDFVRRITGTDGEGQPVRQAPDDSRAP